MRAVADTNVYISALNFGGTAEEVLTLARARAIELFTSPLILTEVEGVLIRTFRWSASRARDAIALIRDFAGVARPAMSVEAITEDAPDNRILECALAAEAEVMPTATLARAPRAWASGTTATVVVSTKTAVPVQAS